MATFHDGTMAFKDTYAYNGKAHGYLTITRFHLTIP